MPISSPSSSSTRSRRTSNRACGIDSECSSPVTVSARRAPACSRSRVSSAASVASVRRSSSRSARSSAIRSSDPSRLTSRCGGVARPLEDLVDRLAVLPGERGQRRPPLGDGGQPGGVGLHARGVGRDVGRHVGEQVADLGDPVGQRRDLGVVLADALQRPPGARPPRPARRERPASDDSASRAVSAAVRRVSAKPEPRLLGGERLLLAGLRVDGLDLLESQPQHVGLAGTFAGGPEHLAQLGLDLAQPGEAGAVARRAPRRARHRRRRRARRAGPRVAAAGAGRTGRARRRAPRRPATARTPAPRHRPGRPASDPRRTPGGPAAAGPDSTSPPCSSAISLEHLVGPHDALDAGRAGAGAHRAGVGATAQQQAERGDQHGLAGAGLTGDHGQPVAELEHGLVDDAQGADPDLLDHRAAVTGPRSASAGRRSRASRRRAVRTWRRGGR